MYFLLILEYKGQMVSLMPTCILITPPPSSKSKERTFMCIPCYFTAWLVDHDRVIYHLIPGVAFLLDCRLNNPNVSVEIYRKKLDEAFQRVYPRTDRFVKQNGQTFTITGLATKSKFTFECRTTTREAGTPVLKKTVAIERAKGLKQQ